MILSNLSRDDPPGYTLKSSPLNLVLLSSTASQLFILVLGTVP